MTTSLFFVPNGRVGAEASISQERKIYIRERLLFEAERNLKTDPTHFRSKKIEDLKKLIVRELKIDKEEVAFVIEYLKK